MQFQKMGIVPVRDKKERRKRNQKKVLRGKQRQENKKTKIDISVAHTMEASIRKGIIQRME